MNDTKQEQWTNLLNNSTRSGKIYLLTFLPVVTTISQTGRRVRTRSHGLVRSLFHVGQACQTIRRFVPFASRCLLF